MIRNSHLIRSVYLILRLVIAIYNLPLRRGNQELIGLSRNYFHVSYKGKQVKIPIDEIAGVILEMRNKLAPLIVGGIITSLGLLSIFIYSYRLEIIGLVAAGMLLTYYGMQKYLVLHIEHGSTAELIWLPYKVTLSSIRPLIAMLEYYVSKSNFPLLAVFSSDTSQRLIHYEDQPVLTSSPILFAFASSQMINNQMLIVNPALLDAPIEISSDEKIIAKGNYLINHTAAVETDATRQTY